MKKLLSFIITSVILLSACAVGNNNRMWGANEGGADARRLSFRGNNTGAIYKDGIYTGSGNPHNNGNEMATVTISRGRIEDIELTTDKLQRGANNTNKLIKEEGTVVDDKTDVPENDTNVEDGREPKDVILGDAINDVRTRLTEAMISEQRYDVDVEDNYGNFSSTVYNWKLAVRRALEEAKR